MAITTTKNPIDKLRGGSGDVQEVKYNPYTPSAAVNQAQTKLAQVEAQKPGTYNSKYGAQLESILGQIQNPKEFKYEFNGDELFKQYADLYTQKGRQASMDVMGQAAGLTGGYGNSYAQQVGNQAYDQYLLNLYDKGLELRDRAYQKYQDERADLYNQYGTLYQQDQSDYGRYRDTWGDWLNEREYYTGRYDTERNFDYGQYNDNRSFAEQQRQFNESLEWEKMSAEQKYAAEYAMQMLANGQMPSEAILMAAGLSAADAQKIMAPAQVVVAGGGGRTSKTTVYIDQNGSAFTLDKNGNPTYLSREDLNKNKNKYVVDEKSYAGETVSFEQKTKKENKKTTSTNKYGNSNYNDTSTNWKK